PLLQDVARVGDHLDDALQSGDVLPSLVAEHFTNRFEIETAEIPGEQVLLELLEALHLAHQLDGLLVVERALTVKQVTVATAKFLEVMDVAELLEQVVKIPLGVRVLETVLLQLLDRLADAQRQPVELLALL